MQFCIFCEKLNSEKDMKRFECKDIRACRDRIKQRIIKDKIIIESLELLINNE